MESDYKSLIWQIVDMVIEEEGSRTKDKHMSNEIKLPITQMFKIEN